MGVVPKKSKSLIHIEMTENKTSAEEKYRDIIDLPHHESQNRPRLSMESRAAQFAPFAALSGHEEALEEGLKEVLRSYGERAEKGETDN